MPTTARHSALPAPDRPHGTLQVDVDDLWVYYESIGLAAPVDAPPLAFTVGVPRLLDLFDRYDIRATFFVCGRDLGPDCPSQRAAVREIVARGHEVANHSLAHRNGYARLEAAALRDDIASAGERIGDAIGRRPVGFKAPGFSYNPALPRVLSELGYLYDSSLLPTWFAPLLRAVQGRLSGGHVDPTHYGRPAYGLAPLHPHRLPVDSSHRDAARSAEPRRLEASGTGPLAATTVWEAPVSTIPIVRAPMHSTFALSAGQWLFDWGVALVKARGVPINYLLHAADVWDAVADPRLASYRFLATPWDAKRTAYERMLQRLSASWQLAPTAEFVAAWQAAGNPPA